MWCGNQCFERLRVWCGEEVRFKILYGVGWEQKATSALWYGVGIKFRLFRCMEWVWEISGYYHSMEWVGYKLPERS